MTTSIQAYEPSEALLDYAAIKAALNNLVVNLGAISARPTSGQCRRARANLDTLDPSTFGPEKVDGFGVDTPLGRAGQPVEVAAAFVFLASAEASYISGTVLGITGGPGAF